MAEIRHLENRHDVFFSAEGGPIWIKFRRLMQNDVSTAVMWSKSKPDVEFQYGGRFGEYNGMSSQSHVSHCRVLPLGEFTVTIPEPHATLQGARILSTISKIVLRHMLFCVLMQFRLWWAAAFVSSPMHLFIIEMRRLTTSGPYYRPGFVTRSYLIILQQHCELFVCGGFSWT